MSVYFFHSQYGGKVFFDAMGPPWPKHPCTDSLNWSINNYEIKGLSKTVPPRDIYQPQPLVNLDPGWFHTFCSNIQTHDSEPTVTVFFLGDKGEEKKLFSRIQRDQVDVDWPILLRRSTDRKHYELSTLKAKEAEPSELRFTAFFSVIDLLKFESALHVKNDISEINKILPSVKPVVASKLATARPKLTIDLIKGVKEKKQKIKVEERENREKEEATRRAEKAINKAKEREDLLKNSVIEKTKKPKFTNHQIRENKKQQQRDLQKDRSFNVDQGPVKTALELAFENVKNKLRIL